MQRVIEASVASDGVEVSAIDHGLLVLLGIEGGDNIDDIKWLVQKICSLRVFNDEHRVMNLSLEDISGELLLISQFTLHASIKKGRRPSYVRSAHPSIAAPLYRQTIDMFENVLSKKIQTGIFGADMKVSLTNDGPVTLFIDTKNRE